MQINTKAIVLGSIKYGDNGMIVKCFTHEEGVKSYLLQGILKRKKGKVLKAHFLPLSILKIQTSNSSNGLGRIKESQVLRPTYNLHTEQVKQAIVFFLSEFLSTVLKEDQGENSVLYEYLESAIVWLDEHDEVADFHLIFLMELTKFLGFYPETSLKDQAKNFDLLEGVYQNKVTINSINGNQLALFNNILGIKFDNLTDKVFNREQRKVILEIIIKYYQLHLKMFKKLKTIQVLNQVL